MVLAARIRRPTDPASPRPAYAGDRENRYLVPSVILERPLRRSLP